VKGDKEEHIDQENERVEEVGRHIYVVVQAFGWVEDDVDKDHHYPQKKQWHRQLSWAARKGVLNFEREIEEQEGVDQGEQREDCSVDEVSHYQEYVQAF